MQHRGIQYRVHPGTRGRADYMAGIAGACRNTWNWARWRQRTLYREHKAGKRQDPPSFSYFSAGKEFTQLRRSPERKWLQNYPHREVKYTLKHFEEAMKEAAGGKRGFPRRKNAEDRNDSFTIPTAPKIRDGKRSRELWIPGVRGRRAGFWVAITRRGGDPCAEIGEARSVTLRRRPCGRWFASVTWAIPDEALPEIDRAIGVDMNVGQVTASDGAVFAGPDLARLERRRRKFQRREDRRDRVLKIDRETGEVCRKMNGEPIKVNSKRRERARKQRARVDGKIAYARQHYCHTTSAKLARKASTNGMVRLTF